MTDLTIKFWRSSKMQRITSARKKEKCSSSPRKIVQRNNYRHWRRISRNESAFWSANWRLDMRAVCWSGKSKVEVTNVPDPEIVNPHDAIIRVSLTAICGSDLHMYDGYIPTMKHGDVLGHEFM